VTEERSRLSKTSEVEIRRPKRVSLGGTRSKSQHGLTRLARQALAIHSEIANQEDEMLGTEV